MKSIIKSFFAAIIIGIAAPIPMHAQSTATDAVFINPSGNVGIGTSTPISKLHLYDGQVDDYLTITAPLAAQSAIKFSDIFNGQDIVTYRPAGTRDYRIYSPTALDIFSVTQSGYVGIGTTKPVNKLQVEGNLHMDGNAIYFRQNPADLFDYIRWNSGTDRVVMGGYNGVTLGYTNTGMALPTPVLTVNQSGNVGIGNENPTAKLNVIGNIYAGVTTAAPANVHDPMYRGTTRIGMNSGDFTGMELTTEPFQCGSGGVVKFFTWGCNVYGAREVVRINENGYVGIGTSSPAVPLDIAVSGVKYVGSIQDQYAYLGYQWNSNRGNDYLAGLSGRNADKNLPASIFAQSNIVALSYIAISDARVKTNLKNPGRESSLEKINLLKVTDYNYIDNVANGIGLKRGFIAQEVEKILPQAVSTSVNFIPDIFDLATQTNIKNGVLTVAMKKPHLLVSGDVIRISTEQNTIKEVSVSVIDQLSFSVQNWTEPAGQLFIYGKKVADFRTVDYQQIFATGIGAIQELSGQMNKLKLQLSLQDARIKELENQNTNLMANMETRLKALETKNSAEIKTGNANSK